MQGTLGDRELGQSAQPPQVTLLVRAGRAARILGSQVTHHWLFYLCKLFYLSQRSSLHIPPFLHEFYLFALTKYDLWGWNFLKKRFGED